MTSGVVLLLVGVAVGIVIGMVGALLLVAEDLDQR